jgi:adenylate cyclase
MQLWRQHPWLLRAAALLLPALIVWPWPGTEPSIRALEDRTGDLVWRLSASGARELRVVLVDIDERSLQEIGPWPWPRDTVADLATRLGAAGVQIQAYDITFADDRAGDDALRAAWAQQPTVIAQLFSIVPEVTPAVGRVAGALATPGCPGFAPQVLGHYGTAPELLAAQPTVGHITPHFSSDGIVRQLPALVCQAGRAYPTLALAALWRAAQPADGARPEQLPPAPDWRWDQPHPGSLLERWLAPHAWLRSASLPSVLVPLDAQGRLRVPYALKRQAFISVSAADVLRGRVDPSLLQGAITLIGSTAFGMSDTVATPHGALATGLEVHAQTLVGLLDRTIAHAPARWPAVQLALMSLMAALLLALGARQQGVPAKRLPLVGLALGIGLVTLALVLLPLSALWLSWFPVVGYAVLASLTLATVEHAFARAQRQRLAAHLGAYLPEPVARRLAASEPTGRLDFERRVVSVLAAEIRNFTALATHRPPDEVAALLHSYCCIAVDAIEGHGGVVENVQGDSIMALWIESAHCPDHAERALAAAEDLVRHTRHLLASSHTVVEDSPVQPLALGVGLEAGTAVVGSYGPERRRAHAVLGEPATVAHMIQQMTVDLSMPIVVGPQLAALLPSAGLEPLGEYLLEGASRHYRLFAPAGWSELVAIDALWAQSASGSGESQPGLGEWSRWAGAARKASATLALPQPVPATRRRAS